MKKFFLNTVFAILLFMPISVFADNKLINGNEFLIYQRSKKDILDKWEIGKLEIPSTIYEVEPSYSAPYRAGVVKQSYLNEVKDNLNYYRYLTGTPKIIDNPINNSDLQTAEVLQYLYYISTNDIDHYLYNVFPKPNDMDEEFYNKGVYANHNIISTYNYMYPIFPFFNESTFTTTAGHRVTLLRPEINYFEYGLGKTTYGRAYANISQFDKMDNSFASYPSPGYFPKQDFNGDSDWDIYLNINNFSTLTETEKNNVIVVIKNLSTDEEYTRSTSQNNLTFYNNYIILFEQPNISTKYYEDDYEVTIRNLKDINGNLTDLTYKIDFYDKFENIESNVSEAVFDLNLSALHFDGKYNENLIKSALEDMNLSVTLESGSNFNMKIENFNIEHYHTNSDGSSYYFAKPVIGKLPSWANDSNNILNNKSIIVYGHEKEPIYKFSYDSTSYEKQVGDNITLSINEFKSDYDGNVIYLWVKEKNGIFEVLEDENKYSTDGLNLKINKLSKEDEGNYYLTAFLMPYQYINTFYYISKPINLIVNDKSSISFDEESISIKLNSTKKLEPIIEPKETDTKLTWNSSNDDIISVDEDGNVSGLKVGNATITVQTENGLSATINVFVEEFIKGDMNENGKIDFVDVITALKKYLKIEEINTRELAIGDMNDDNKLEFVDVISILKIYLGIE